jgi:hypothetical protein
MDGESRHPSNLKVRIVASMRQTSVRNLSLMGLLGLAGIKFTRSSESPDSSAQSRLLQEASQRYSNDSVVDSGPIRAVSESCASKNSASS